MTAISRCLATQHPCPQLTEERGKSHFCTRPGCLEIIQECYSCGPEMRGKLGRSEICQRFQVVFRRRAVRLDETFVPDKLGAKSSLSALWKAPPRPQPSPVSRHMLADPTVTIIR